MPLMPETVTIWTEIPVRNLDASGAFYARVTGMALHRKSLGASDVVFIGPGTGVGCHLKKGQPAVAGTGPVIHLAARGPIDAVAARVRAEGGQVRKGPIALDSGRYILCTDPDGNPIGFFEAS